MSHHLLIATAAADVDNRERSAAFLRFLIAPSLPAGDGSVELITIPLDDDPRVKAITGALFEPEGAGPFPAVIHLTGCEGPNSASAVKLQRVFVDEDVAQGEAVLILDLFSAARPRERRLRQIARHGLPHAARRRRLCGAEGVGPKARHRCESDGPPGIWRRSDRGGAGCPPERGPQAWRSRLQRRRHVRPVARRRLEIPRRARSRRPCGMKLRIAEKPQRVALLAQDLRATMARSWATSRGPRFAPRVVRQARPCSGPPDTRSPLLSGRNPAARILSVALVALSVALSASAALAGSDYPPGLFENSPVVGPGGQALANPAGLPAGCRNPDRPDPPIPTPTNPAPGLSRRRRAALCGRRGTALCRSPETSGADRADGRVLRRHRDEDFRQPRGRPAGARGVRSSSTRARLLARDDLRFAHILNWRAVDALLRGARRRAALQKPMPPPFREGPSFWSGPKSSRSQSAADDPRLLAGGFLPCGRRVRKLLGVIVLQ